MASLRGVNYNSGGNNSLEIDTSKIAEDVLSKLIESDPDILGVVKNLIKKKIDLISTEDIEDPKEVIRNIFGFSLDSEVISLMTRMYEIERQLGITGYQGFPSIKDRIEKIEYEIERIKNDIGYLRMYKND